MFILDKINYVMILSDEDKEYICFAKQVIDKSHYPNPEKITDVYNRCFADRQNFKKRQHTNCGTCLRHMVIELYNAYQKIVKNMEKE